MSERDWTQVVIVHLSDLHFGKPHRFQPDITPDGDAAGEVGFPPLSSSVLRDVSDRLKQLHRAPNGETRKLTGLLGLAPKSVRTIFALTGDLTEIAAPEEFKKAQGFVDDILATPLFNPPLTHDDVFVVPGNHDLVYDAPEVFDRWSRYCNFYGKHAGQRVQAHPQTIDAEFPQGLSRIIDQSQSGLVVAEINSAAYVRKDSPEAMRGHIETASLSRLKRELEAIDPAAMRRSIRLAMIHHHPVVLPTLAEPGRGYDAVVNAGAMLGLLKKHGFHVILHGHKHDAQTFPHDSVSAWSGTGSQPMMVVSGGSAGSRGLPADGAAKNTYNIISVKWHPRSSQARIRIETRGLVLLDDHNEKILPEDWKWKELRADDRLLKGSGTTMPSAAKFRKRVKSDWPLEQARAEELKRVRRCFPVVEVVPSLNAEQAFEARVWIDGQPNKDSYELPSVVEWNAGTFFSTIARVEASADPTFAARFSYYGPTSIQARMSWPDGHEAVSYIFAHFPGAGPAIANPLA